MQSAVVLQASRLPALAGDEEAIGAALLGHIRLDKLASAPFGSRSSRVWSDGFVDQSGIDSSLSSSLTWASGEVTFGTGGVLVTAPAFMPAVPEQVLVVVPGTVSPSSLEVSWDGGRTWQAVQAEKVASLPGNPEGNCVRVRVALPGGQKLSGWAFWAACLPGLLQVFDLPAAWQRGTITDLEMTPSGALQLPDNWALDLDGSGDYVKVPWASSLDVAAATNRITIEARIRKDAQVVGPIVEYNNGSALGPNFWNHDTWDKLFINFVDTAGATHQVMSAAGQFVVGQEYHVAAVYDGATGYLYKNGQLIASASLGSFTMRTGSGFNLYIGCRPSGTPYYWNGLVDEVRLWNRALSQAEIQQNMSRKLTGTEPGLVGYWRLDEGSGTTAKDSSPYGNHGTIYGNPLWVDFSKLSGEWVSPSFDLAVVGISGGSEISWLAEVGEGASLSMSRRLSYDRGETWGAWEAVGNGVAIPGLEPGADLSNVFLQVKAAFSRPSGSVAVVLSKLRIKVAA